MKKIIQMAPMILAIHSLAATHLHIINDKTQKHTYNKETTFNLKAKEPLSWLTFEEIDIERHHSDHITAIAHVETIDTNGNSHYEFYEEQGLNKSQTDKRMGMDPYNRIIKNIHIYLYDGKNLLWYGGGPNLYSAIPQDENIFLQSLRAAASEEDSKLKRKALFVLGLLIALQHSCDKTYRPYALKLLEKSKHTLINEMLEAALTHAKSGDTDSFLLALKSYYFRDDINDLSKLIVHEEITHMSHGCCTLL